MIREFVENGNGFAQQVGNYDGSLNLTEASHDSANIDALDPNSLMVEIEGIHAAPFATRNYTRYTAKCLKNSVDSWTNPYRRPLIKHHNEENGEPIGRIIAAEYMSRGTRSGTPALKFTVNVPDEVAKENIKNGLLSTTSIGVIAHDVRCSICGKPVIDAEQGCGEHQRGVTYKTENGEQTCYWDIHDMEAKELSYVDVPSDMYAKNIDYYPAQEKSSNQPQIKESLDNSIQGKGEQHMAEQKELTELEGAKAKVSELEAAVKELREANTASESKVAELTESNKALEAQVAELTESKTALEAAVEEAKQLKESMEQEIADSKAALKEAMIDSFLTLREALGEEVTDVDAIKERPIDSLKYSIYDMKESLSKRVVKVEVKESTEEKKVDLPARGSIKDPGLSNEHEIKESVQLDNIDLKAGLQSIFNAVMSAHK